tara:strand:+ start:512 stop:1018 length:507 start_codon:yes stop_codon:yes gene_type:complete
MGIYYTSSGDIINNPEAYARTGFPMFTDIYSNNINKERTIYKINCIDGKKYIGETGNYNKRIWQHFNGMGSQVTRKFKPISARILTKVPGYFAKKAEQEYVNYYIKKYGYNNVRGGKYTNSLTLKKVNIYDKYCLSDEILSKIDLPKSNNDTLIDEITFNMSTSITIV